MDLNVSPSSRGSRHHLHPKIRVDIQGVTFYTGRAPGGPRWSWRGLAPRVASFCHATLSWPSIRPHHPSFCRPAPLPLHSPPCMSPASLPSHLPSPLTPPPPPSTRTLLHLPFLLLKALPSFPFHSPTHHDTPPGLIYTCYCLAPLGRRVTFWCL